jgi:hypothetical protein
MKVLINAWLDEELATAELPGLEASLREDPARLRDLVFAAALQENLRASYRATAEVTVPTPTPPSARAVKRWRRLALPAGGIAAALLVGIVVALQTRQPPPVQVARGPQGDRKADRAAKALDAGPASAPRGDSAPQDRMPDQKGEQIASPSIDSGKGSPSSAEVAGQPAKPAEKVTRVVQPAGAPKPEEQPRDSWADGTAAPARELPAAQLPEKADAEPRLSKDSPPRPLHSLIHGSDLIVVATVQVPPPQAPAAPRGVAAEDQATLTIERILKRPQEGPRDPQTATLRFRRGERIPGDVVPQDGQRALWLLAAGTTPGEYSCVSRGHVLPATDEAIARVERIVSILQTTAAGRPPAEAEIRGMVAGPDWNEALLGMHLIGATDPARYADVLQQKLAAGEYFQGELDRAVRALPPDVGVPLLMEVIGGQRGNYLLHDAAKGPLRILGEFTRRGPLPEPLKALIRRGLLARYEQDGSIFREQLGSGDTLIAVLADVADGSCADVLRQAVVVYPMREHELAEFQRLPGGLAQLKARIEGMVDPGAVAGLWNVQGREALPFLRDHVRHSESAIQKILGEHGTVEDFPRLLDCIATRGGFAAQDAMKRLVERAGLETEPWMNLRDSAQDATLADRWQAWWEAHRERVVLSEAAENTPPAAGR